MKGISVFLYSLKQAFKNMRQNRLYSLASVGTIAACLFLFGVFYSVVSNLTYMIKSAETSVGITVFFVEGISEDQIKDIGDQISARNEVSKVVYVSAEEAWERFKNDSLGEESEELAKTFGNDNPLKDSASYEVYLNDVAKQGDLIEYINTIDGVRMVNSSEATAKWLNDVNRLMGYVSVAIIILLLAVSIFLISTTVSSGFAVRKKEIGLMRLIGATDLFIELPFIFEGIIIGLVGTVIPVVIMYIMYNRIIEFIYSKFKILTGVIEFLDGSTIFSMLIPVSFAIGIGIGFVGSIWTTKKHMSR